MTRRKLFTTLACYLAVIALVFAFSFQRVRQQNSFAAQTAPDTLPEYSSYTRAPDENSKPFFSLLTNHTYATTDRARLSLNYHGIDQLEFRVYKVRNPVEFFKGLDNPHQVGEDEAEQISEKYKRAPTFLEKLRGFKNSIYKAIRGYVRAQLQHDARKSFNRKFRADADDDESNRVPLNVADYARVPLLNPDQLVSSWREKLSPMEDEYDRRMISLGRREPGVYLIEAINGGLRAYCIAMVTDLTLVQKTTSDGQLLVYAVDRKTGAPRENAQIEIIKGHDTIKRGATNNQGILQTKIDKPRHVQSDAEEANANADDEDESGESESATPAQNTYLVTASERDNFAVSDLDSFYFGGDGSEEDAGGNADLKSYIYTDRPVYRPAQKIYFKGILRRLTENGYKLPAGNQIAVSIEDPNGARILERSLTLSSRGTFSGEVEVADEAPLGTYNITAELGEDKASGSFDVQEYKKPEFKASVTIAQKYANVGEHAKFNVSARYFFGAPVARADVKYYIYRARAYSWWGGDSEDGEDASNDFGVDSSAEDKDIGSGSSHYYYGSDMVQEGEGKLDANGRLDIDFVVPPPDAADTWDYTYRLEAQVTDPSRRTMEGSASFTGIRANTVAYAQPERNVYYQGDTARILVHANDHEGRPVQTKVKLTFFERRWDKVIKKTESGDEYPDYELHERELSNVSVDTNALGKSAIDYVVPISGSVHIKTTIVENNQSIVSEGGSIWVADPKNQFSDFSYEDAGAIKLVPDKKSYRVGDTAHILALLPNDKAHLLVTTELMSVLTVRQIDAASRAVMIDLPIEARYAPNVYLNVTYVQKGEMYTQDQLLVVPARDKLLNLQIIPNKKEYKPRETASYTIFARNMDNTPAANAEISFGVVDESIYSIQPESIGDIRREFYGQRYNAVQTSSSFSYIFTGYAGKKIVKLAQNKRAYQLADFKNDNSMVEPVVRKIFKDTAFWQPNVTTGADGKANVKVQLPDNLTTWRATSRAITADTRVGTTTQKIVARKDVIIRIASPRFLTQGDTVVLSGIVHNYLKADKPTQISIDVSGGQLQDPARQTVTIPKNGEYRVNWRVAAPATGELKILAKALTDTESDALETSIPIAPRGLKQTRGHTLAISEENADQTVTFRLPNNAEAGARSLRIETSPSIAAMLFGALDYLTAYPYGCTEQTMSQFLPTVIVAQTLKDVPTANIKATNDIARKVQKGLKRLYNYQHEDGGWGWWKDDPTDAFMSAYVVDGLWLAKRAGYEIDDTRLSRGRDKLKAMLDAGKLDDNTSIDAESRAYMIYALNESGGTDARLVNDLFNSRNNLQPYGRALLALALRERGDTKRAQIVAGEIERSVISNDAEARWSSRHKTIHDATETNDVEATALSVKALARIMPQSALLPKAARWLVMSRKYGAYWLSTKETAFAIFGLTDYLKVSQELSPDYTMEVYLNGEQVLSRQMTSADAASAQTFVIGRKGTEVGNTSEVRVVKRGRGMLYVSTTVVHYTNDEQTAAQSSPQLKLTREYLRLRVLENEKGQPAWKLEPLAGDVHSGDLIVSRLRVEGEPARYLMIEDPIPAGCEQVEAVSGIDLNYNEHDWSDWYSAREFRDQKAVFFLNYFSGKATYQYAMRVEVPGQFRIAPARVEQMYQPEVQANAASGALTILDNK